MSYVDKAKEFGKQPVQIVELYMTRCTRTYGSAPCTASIGVTGSDRCFNTAGSCQDRSNYAESSHVYRFATSRINGLQAVGDPPIFPTLQTVKTAPTILTPGKGLGVRSSVTVTIADHPWTDVGCDPYVSLRSYDPDAQGTFWGRWIARNKFYTNRRIDVLTGFLNDDGSYDAANFKRRSYIVTKISGPTAGGTVTIEAKDPLKLADGEKAQWPRASTSTLTSTVNELVTSIAITDPKLDFTTWWNAGQRYFRCEDEIMLATAVGGIGTASVTLTVTRGTMPNWYDFSQNVAYGHDAGASMQPCWLFDQEMVYDVVYFLLNTAAGVDASYLPLATWEAEIDAGFQYLEFSALLTEPVSVKNLLTEITELGVLLWWHEREQEVLMTGLRFRQIIGPQINDSQSIIANSVAVSEDTAALMTQSWIYFDLTWPLANMDLLRSYRNVDIRQNVDRETVVEYGRASIKTVITRWLPRSQLGVAVSIGSTLLRQYQDVRKIITWSMDPKDDSYWVGDTVGVSTRYVQDDTGAPAQRNYLITQVEEVYTDRGLTLKYTAIEMFAFVRTGVITHPSNPGGPVDPTPAPPNYSSASDAEKNTWAYISPNTPTSGPQFADGTPAYQII